MAIQRTELEVHSTTKEKRIYLPFSVNLRDMRLALQRLATSVASGELKLGSTPLDTYASEMIHAKIQGCDSVTISQEKRQLFIRAIDSDGATHLYATPLPPEWPRAQQR